MSISIWQLVLVLIIILILKYLYKFLKLLVKGKVFCAWCGSKNIKFFSGNKGNFYWIKENKDGSQDKRVKGNYQLASYTSIYECPECNAKTKFGYDDSEKPSHLNKIRSRSLLNEGKGIRVEKNWQS